jgi:hypothetical protein
MAKRKIQTDKQLSTKHYTQNWRLSSKSGWTQVLRKGRQFLFHMWYPSGYYCYKPGDKASETSSLTWQQTSSTSQRRRFFKEGELYTGNQWEINSKPVCKALTSYHDHLVTPSDSMQRTKGKGLLKYTNDIRPLV